jgi:hypothetical protein
MPQRVDWGVFIWDIGGLATQNYNKRNLCLTLSLETKLTITAKIWHASAGSLSAQKHPQQSTI